MTKVADESVNAPLTGAQDKHSVLARQLENRVALEGKNVAAEASVPFSKLLTEATGG